MIETHTSSSPAFVPTDYKARFKTPCALDVAMSESHHQDWYAGTGIRPVDHPLTGTIQFSGCGSCGSDNVFVIAAQWCVSYASGDAYWDYEIACNACGKYTQRSYCEK